MKRAFQILISMLFIASTVLLAAGCAPKPPSETSQPQTQPTKLTIWINGRDSFIGPNEQKLSQDQ
ncbi:MAG: hypothetical protein ACPL0B_03345 [Anaerolineales bacterium]